MLGKKPGPDDPPLTYECDKCGTPYKTIAEALACGCRRKDNDD